MKSHLSREEFIKHSKHAKRMGVYQEFDMEGKDMISVIEKMVERHSDAVVFESDCSKIQKNKLHYTLISYGLIAQLKMKNNVISVRCGNKTTFKNINNHHDENPFITCRQLINQLDFAPQNSVYSDFIYGGFGVMSYDAIRIFEKIPDRHLTNEAKNLPDVMINFYENHLIFDHSNQKFIIDIMTEFGNNPDTSYDNARQKILNIHSIVQKFSSQLNLSHTINKIKFKENMETDIDDESYKIKIEKAKSYIKSGDAFQIVLSRNFKKKYTSNPFYIFRTLRSINPSPYMFYFSVDKSIIIGASPEKLISVNDRKVSSHPIAGSRKKNDNSNLFEIEKDLLSDPKEKAEHMMLVDLARNDLGAVCKPGSIKVEELLSVKHFSHISHIASSVTGDLVEEKDAFDALIKAFPAGTLSGAPKIRAMEIIDELENSKRGLYGGTIFRFDFKGNLDSCIAIRMAELKNGQAHIRAGGGIVYDSDPFSEANETRQKAKALFDAIHSAENYLQNNENFNQYHPLGEIT